jgi:hypothetical protein
MLPREAAGHLATGCDAHTLNPACPACQPILAGVPEQAITRRSPLPGKPKADCPRCIGTGYIHRFNHVAAGVCFQCFGKKVS